MRLFAVAMVAILVAEPVAAAEREVVKSDWNGFRQQVSSRKLEGRSVRIRLSGGGEVKTNLLEVTETGFVVRATRATKQWKSVDDKARIPKEQVASVRFGGRVGRGGLIGGLVGLGAGAGATSVLIAGIQTSGRSPPDLSAVIFAGIVFTAVGGLVGYFIGRSIARPAPEFVLTQ